MKKSSVCYRGGAIAQLDSTSGKKKDSSDYNKRVLHFLSIGF
jgi:hypothetical protein